ncbi:putative kinesin-like protein unc-104-like, partial [Homarus americanus]
MPATDSDNMSEAERATALKFARFMQGRSVQIHTKQETPAQTPDEQDALTASVTSSCSSTTSAE